MSRPPTDLSPDALVVAGATKRYPGFVLDNVSLRLPRGAVMGLVGPNGAGKTTLIRVILNLARLDAGTVQVLGRDPAKDELGVKTRVGFVHETPPFPPLLTLERIRALAAPFYPQWNEGQFRALTREFKLPLQRRFHTLSRGMKTQFSLALALSHQAELLVMDEPTTGLDPAARRRFLDLLLDVLQDERCAVLFSTHLTADLDRVADYVSLIQQGRLVFSASVEDFREGWGLVKGGLESLDGRESGLLKGCRRHACGFEALTADVLEARRRFGPTVVVERPTLEDLVIFTAPSAQEAS